MARRPSTPSASVAARARCAGSAGIRSRSCSNNGRSTICRGTLTRRIMVRLVAIYPVRDFDDFMREMSKNADARAARGITLHSIHRSVDDPNEVMVTVEFASREAAEVVLQAEDALRAW